MIRLTEAEAATKAYDSTATVKSESGVSHLISCWHDESADVILARAAKFYEQPMAEVVNINQIWTR